MSETMPNSDSRIGVVIVAYNSRALLEACLAGTLMDPQVTIVVVVDNSSCAASAKVVQTLAATDSRVHYVDPAQNLGFARGCNLGASIANGSSHLFFVNPDVRLDQPLSPLVAELERSGAAIVSGLLNTPGHHGSVNARAIVSWPREFLKAIAGSRIYLPKRRAADYVKREAPFQVGQVDGALLGLRQETFAELGGFDERFELYYEDVDICRRAYSLGGCLFVPQEWGVHVGGASSSSASELSYAVGRISRVRYLKKHYGDSMLVACGIRLLSGVEFLARTLTRQSEGTRVRRQTVQKQLAELATPGSVHLLS